MSESTVWWALAGGLVGIEMLIGTFYLLMVALGAVAGALAAHAGLGVTTQIVIAALLGGGAVALWHWKRASNPATLRATANQDVNMDIGGTVQVDAWDAEAHATVRYRGADWAASLAPGASAKTGTHRIIEVLGSRLVVTPIST